MEENNEENENPLYQGLTFSFEDAMLEARRTIRCSQDSRGYIPRIISSIRKATTYHNQLSEKFPQNGESKREEEIKDLSKMVSDIITVSKHEE